MADGDAEPVLLPGERHRRLCCFNPSDHEEGRGEQEYGSDAILVYELPAGEGHGDGGGGEDDRRTSRGYYHPSPFGAD